MVPPRAPWWLTPEAGVALPCLDLLQEKAQTLENFGGAPSTGTCSVASKPLPVLVPLPGIPFLSSPCEL